MPRLTLIALMLLAPLTIPAAASPVAEANQALDIWRPISIEESENVLIITSKERRVEEQIYRSMMLTGLCAYVEIGLISLQGITNVVIINRFQESGWVFRGGASLCKEIMSLPREDRQIQLLVNSNLY